VTEPDERTFSYQTVAAVIAALALLATVYYISEHNPEPRRPTTAQPTSRAAASAPVLERTLTRETTARAVHVPAAAAGWRAIVAPIRESESWQRNADNVGNNCSERTSATLTHGDERSSATRTATRSSMPSSRGPVGNAASGLPPKPLPGSFALGGADTLQRNGQAESTSGRTDTSISSCMGIPTASTQGDTCLSTELSPNANLGAGCGQKNGFITAMGSRQTTGPRTSASSDLMRHTSDTIAEAGTDGSLKERPASRKVTMLVTSYCACFKCTNKHPGDKGYGITASGQPVSANGSRFVAADRAIPLGTRISIPGYSGGKPVPVLDRGGAIKGDKLDVYCPTHQAALNWGRQQLVCEVMQ